MTTKPDEPKPIHHLASENIGQILELVDNYAATERELAGAANEPQVAVLRERLVFLKERFQRLMEEARALSQSARQSVSRLAQAAYLSVSGLLTWAGFAFARITLSEFNLGQAATWFCLGLAIMVPFAVHRFLERFRQEWVHNLLIIFTLVTGLAAVVLFAEVRGDVFSHHLDTGAAVIMDRGGQEEPLPSDDGAQPVFAILQLAMVFAALAFELGAGLALFAFTEARRNSDQGRRDRVEKELNQTLAQIQSTTREMRELMAQPIRQHAEQQQRLKKSILERLNKGRNKLGVRVTAVLLSAATAQAGGKLHVVTAWDLTITQTVEYNGHSEVEQNRQAIATILRRLPAGAKITVIGITDQTYVNPHILLSAELTTDAGYFESRLETGRRQLVAAWHKRSKELKPSYKATDILGAMRYAGEVLERGKAERKVLVIFSDGRNYSRELDLESPRTIAVNPSLTKVRKQGLLCSLAGVEVYLFAAGDHSGKRGTGYTLGLKEFWSAYVQEAGGTLEVFSTTREPHGLQLITSPTTGGTSP